MLRDRTVSTVIMRSRVQIPGARTQVVRPGHSPSTGDKLVAALLNSNREQKKAAVMKLAD